MVNMLKLLRNFLIVIAFLALFAFFTNSAELLLKANRLFLLSAIISYLISIIIWIFAWGILIRKEKKINFGRLFKIGFASIVGSFTPIQLGVEALRILHLKKLGIGIKNAVGASMLVKGAKFAIILLLAIIFSQPLLNSPYFVWIVNGLVVIFMATLLFLLPLVPDLGYLLAGIIGILSNIKYLNFLKKLREYFLFYIDYLKGSKKSITVAIFFLAAFSWAFEVISLACSFLSVNLILDISTIIYTSALISILERIPFLPRGVGLLELICFYFLGAMQLNVSQIGAALIIFAFARLIFPVLLAIAFSFLYSE